MSLRLVLLITAGLILACSALGHAQVLADSAGVRRVSYPRTAQPRSTWHLSDQPLLVVGAGEDASTEFSAVRGVVRLSGGGVAIANGGTNEIRIFASDGAFVRSLGRTGGGPGEFQRITRLLRTGDTLVGVDGDSRAHVFDPNGRLLRSLRPARRAGSGSPQRIGLGARATTWVLVSDASPTAEREHQVITQTLTQSDVAGDSLNAIVAFASYRTRLVQGKPIRLLLDAGGVAAASEYGACLGYSDRFAITCYDRLGRARLRLVRETDARAIREEERALVRQAYLDANRDAPPQIRQQMVQAVNAFPFASDAPRFSRLLLRPDGELWVSPFDPGFGLPGPGAPLAPSTTHTWSVFAPDGTLLAAVPLPARFVPYEVGRDYVAGVAFDEDDVERVVVWGLRR